MDVPVSSIANIALVEVPSGAGATFQGLSRTPEGLKRAGLLDKLRETGFNVSTHDALERHGPIESATSGENENGVRNEEKVLQVNHAVKDTLMDALKRTDTTPFTLVVGGDCSMCPAVMSAMAHTMERKGKKVGMLYIDADADLYTPHGPGSTGILAAMTFTHLTMRPGALESMRPFSRPDGSPVVTADNTVILGLNAEFPPNARDQLGFLFDEGFQVITSKAVARSSTQAVQRALDYLENKVDCIYVHFDLDAVDAGSFPLGNIPNWTGVPLSTIVSILVEVLQRPKACGLTISEINVDRDQGLRMTTELVNNVVEILATRKRRLE